MKDEISPRLSSPAHIRAVRANVREGDPGGDKHSRFRKRISRSSFSSQWAVCAATWVPFPSRRVPRRSAGDDSLVYGKEGGPPSAFFRQTKRTNRVASETCARNSRKAVLQMLQHPRTHNMLCRTHLRRGPWGTPPDFRKVRMGTFQGWTHSANPYRLDRRGMHAA